jgi:hypothetical protein
MSLNVPGSRDGVCEYDGPDSAGRGWATTTSSCSKSRIKPRTVASMDSKPTDNSCSSTSSSKGTSPSRSSRDSGGAGYPFRLRVDSDRDSVGLGRLDAMSSWRTNDCGTTRLKMMRQRMS